jgi:hypothetical protein
MKKAYHGKYENARKAIPVLMMTLRSEPLRARFLRGALEAEHAD